MMMNMRYLHEKKTRERNYISSLSVYLQKVRKKEKIKVHLHGRIYKNFRHVCLFLMINLTVSRRKEIVMEQEQIYALDKKEKGTHYINYT